MIDSSSVVGFDKFYDITVTLLYPGYIRVKLQPYWTENNYDFVQLLECP